MKDPTIAQILDAAQVGQSCRILVKDAFLGMWVTVRVSKVDPPAANAPDGWITGSDTFGTHRVIPMTEIKEIEVTA